MLGKWYVKWVLHGENAITSTLGDKIYDIAHVCMVTYISDIWCTYYYD